MTLLDLISLLSYSFLALACAVGLFLLVDALDEVTKKRRKDREHH